MQRSFVRLTILWATIACASSSPAAQKKAPELPGPRRKTGSWVGRRVMVARESANFRVGTRTVGKARLADVLKVAKVNGDWLWVNDARGWIRRRDVVLFDQAIGYFTAAVKARPSYKTYYQRGTVYVSLGRYQQALNDFNLAVKVDQKKITIYNDRGNVLRTLGKPDLAIADFNRVIAGRVKHPAVYTNRGLAWLDKGDRVRALNDFNRAIQIDSKFAPAWEAAGTARMDNGDFAKSIYNFRRAVIVAPHFSRAQNNLAWILAVCPDDQLRNGKEAVKYATKACESAGFQDSGYLDTLAAAHAAAGQFALAVIHATTALKLAATTDKPAIAARLKLYQAGKPFRLSVQKKPLD